MNYLFPGFFFIFLFLGNTQAQQHQWEVGIGLRPSTLEENPFSIIAKKNMWKGIAFRFGVGGLFKRGNELVFEKYPYLPASTPEEYNSRFPNGAGYEYEQVNTKFSLSSFLGVQYGKRKGNLYFYGATDLSFSYQWLEEAVDEVRFNPTRTEEETYLFVTEGFERVDKFSIHQSIGIQYFVLSNVSVSLEGGGFYSYNFVNTDRRSFITDQGWSGAPSTNQNEQTYEFGFSLLNILSINYHF